MPFPRPTRLALALFLLSGTALADNLTPSLQLNGFATAGFTTVTDDFGGRYLGNALMPGSGMDDDGSFDLDNVLGIQLSYQVDERIDLVGQLISTGKESYDTRAEWAYLAYRVNDNLRLRAGRFALPLYMYSENIHVGQAYPWARLPVELYAGVPFSNSDGVDVLYRVALGDWDLNAQAYQGQLFADNQAYSTTVKNLHGANVTLGKDSLSLRLGYNEAKTSVVFNPFLGLPYPNAVSAKTTFADLGLGYDDGRWFAAAEAIQFRLAGYINDMDAGFVSVGHYFGKWLPYVMWSKVNSVNGDECRTTFLPLFALLGPAAPAYADATCRGQEREQTSYSVGFRYDATRHVSLKLEVDHVTDFHDTAGLFGALPPVPGPVTVPGTLRDSDSTEVITFNVNAAF